MVILNIIDKNEVIPGGLKRWRLAAKAVYFIVSLSRKALPKNTQCPLLLPTRVVPHSASPSTSPSHVSLEIVDDNNDSSIIDDDLPEALRRMMRERNLVSLSRFGGAKRLAQTLANSTDQAGCHRGKVIFGSNVVFPKMAPRKKGFFSFVFEALKESTIIIHLLLVLFSICSGIVVNHGIKQGWWYDGVSMLLAVFLAVSLSSISNFMRTRQFEKLTSETDHRYHDQPILVSDVVVGNIVFLQTGDRVPADGLFLAGHSLKVINDELGNDDVDQHNQQRVVEIDEINSPFLFSGTRVTHGYGTMLVTCVSNNNHNETTMMMRGQQQTPLQSWLKKLTSNIAIIALLVASLGFVCLLFGHLTGHCPRKTKTKTTSELTNAAVNVISVAIPEGLPLAITLSLAYSMKKLMASKHALVRKFSAYETMRLVTSICTHKAGILTVNQMEVVEFWQGKEAVDHHNNNKHLNLATNLTDELFGTDKVLGLKMDEEKESFDILRVETINSEKKRIGANMEDKDNNMKVHLKGAATMILPMCSTYYDRKGMVITMDDEDKKDFKETIQSMATKGLRCVAFAHKLQQEDDGDDDQSGLTLLGLVGLKDPCQPGVREAIESCKHAGVDVKVVTTDSLDISKTIGVECGILKADDESHEEIVMKGEKFRNYTPEERLKKIDHIRILAKSSSLDKLLFVQCLKQKGHIVAVTAGSDYGAISNFNDIAALREADVGLSMGVQGTKIATENSDIIILDDNFASIVNVLRSSRCFYNNIQKFIQFQLTVNVATIIINLVAGVSLCNVPLTAAQLLWVNLIMDVVGALALATEQPADDDLMKKPPVSRFEPLITKVMWRNLIAQALYQMIVMLTLQFKGKSIFGMEDDKVKGTIIFNCFILCQVFNEFNARKLERRNIFEGLLENKLFLGIIGMTILLQVVLVEIVAKFANTKKLNWGQWSACIAIAAFTWPLGWLMKGIPV